MLSGFASLEFTPKSGAMPGQFKIIWAESTNGGLYANAAAFTDKDGTSVIFVSMDLEAVTDYFASKTRKNISAATGVPYDNILIAATHTHTGAPAEEDCWVSPGSPEIAEFNIEKATEAAILAWNRREESSLGHGTYYNNTFNFCRDWIGEDGNIRTNPNYKDRSLIVRAISEPDHSVNVMRVDTPEGKIKGFIVNYANHPDTNGYTPSAFCGDFPGYIRRSLQAEYGEDVVVLFFMGAAGDVNCIDFENLTHKVYSNKDTNGPKFIGEALAREIIELNSRIPAKYSDFKIQVKSEVLKVPRKKLSKAQMDKAEAVMADPDSFSVVDNAYAKSHIAANKLPDVMELYFGAVQLGPWTIVYISGELYTEIGRKIRANSPFPHTRIFSATNGKAGYICTDKVITSPTAYPAQSRYADVGSTDIILRCADKILSDFEKNLQ